MPSGGQCGGAEEAPVSWEALITSPSSGKGRYAQGPASCFQYKPREPNTPLPHPASFALQVRPVAEDEMFKVLRTGKRKKKEWKRMVTKVGFGCEPSWGGGLGVSHQGRWA